MPPSSARLKAAGAIVLAKVATVNWFGNGFDETHPIGASLNPYALDHSPGGSSNGPGVAMAAYFATVAIGTDTGGSVRIPSAYNSLFGMVATQGLVSRAGIVPRGATQDRAGPMGRSVYDVAATLAVIAGWDAEDVDDERGFGHFPAADWATELDGRPRGAAHRGVARNDRRGAASTSRAALCSSARSRTCARPAPSSSTFEPGSICKRSPRARSGRTAEYEKLYVQNAYLARLGPAAKFATVQDMIETVGRDKFSRLMLAALDLRRRPRAPTISRGSSTARC